MHFLMEDSFFQTPHRWKERALSRFASLRKLNRTIKGKLKNYFNNLFLKTK